jgi:hypothetical protein
MTEGEVGTQRSAQLFVRFSARDFDLDSQIVEIAILLSLEKL